jgi:hypothetical protein
VVLLSALGLAQRLPTGCIRSRFFLEGRAMERIREIINMLLHRRAMLLVAALSLITLAITALINPAKLGLYVYMVSKLTGAAVLGYVVDLAASPKSDPSQLEGIEQNMAYNRRNTLMAAAIIAAGLMF